MSATDDRSLRIAAAVLALPIAYALLRAIEVALSGGGAVDPTAIVVVGPSAFLRRLAATAALAPMLIAAALATPAPPLRRSLPYLAALAALTPTLAALFAP